MTNDITYARRGPDWCYDVIHHMGRWLAPPPPARTNWDVPDRRMSDRCSPASTLRGSWETKTDYRTAPSNYKQFKRHIQEKPKMEQSICLVTCTRIPARLRSRNNKKNRSPHFSKSTLHLAPLTIIWPHHLSPTSFVFKGGQHSVTLFCPSS